MKESILNRLVEATAHAFKERPLASRAMVREIQRVSHRTLISCTGRGLHGAVVNGSHFIDLEH